MAYLSICEFFLYDGPVISDFTRIVIYGYLMMDCLMSPQIYRPVGNTPLQADVLCKGTRPMFWCVSNRFSALFFCFHKYEYLRWMIKVAKISWFCCIIGLGGITPRLITGILIFILSATISGINKIGVSHRWHVPKWTLLALIFTKFKNYSIDHLIRQYIHNGYNPEPNSVIFDSGFSSKYIQIVSLYTLFAGGVSKLRNGGLKWVLPGNLRYHLSDPFMDSVTVCKSVRNFARNWVLRHPAIIMFMSITALIIELISILGVFLASTRIYVFTAANLFHFGIWLILLPNYFPQCVCYLALIDISFSPPNSARKAIEALTFFDIAIIGVSNVTILGYVLSMVFKYEGWPFTSIPMYSFDRHGFTHQYIVDEKQFEQLMREEYPLCNGFCTGGEDQFSEGNTWIQITKDENVDLIPQICLAVCPMEHGFRHSLWSAVMRSVLISKDEIDKFTQDLFNLLVADDVKLINPDDTLSIRLHFKLGWKTYAKSGNLKKD